MSFDKESIDKEVREWIDKSDTKMQLSSIDEQAKRVDFNISNKDITFYLNQEVTESEEKNKTKWLLWSDSESTLSILQPTIEEVANNRLTSISEILTSCQSNLFEPQSKAAEKKPVCDTNDEEEEEDEDEDEGMDDYYCEPDDIDDMKETVKEKDEDSDDLDDEDTFFGPMNTTTSAAIHRLQKDLKNILKVGPDLGIIAMPRGNNMFLWDVKLKDVPLESRLGKDLNQYAKNHKQEEVLTLEMQFPPDYPFTPPFIRVIKPRFKFLTGHVTIGGSICMEMLTKSGWVPSNDIESILVQVRAEILSDPNASLDLSRANVSYTESEARDAFNRMVSRYGWNK